MAAGIERPWRRALRLDFIRPARLFGPVLHLAFSRLALICFSVAMMMHVYFTDPFCSHLLARPGLVQMMQARILLRFPFHLLARPVLTLTMRIYIPISF